MEEQKYCWRTEDIPQVIDTVALNVEPSILFATHTPFQNIKVHQDRLQPETEKYDEESFLQSILGFSKDKNAFVVVHGAPGTGKSNLIWWLSHRLKSNYDDNARVVLIKRAEASLARTLKSLVEELGEGYGDLVGDLTSALGHLKKKGLGKRLLDRLSESLDPGAVVDPPELSGALSRLQPWDFLIEKQTREVLGREGNILSKIINRLSVNEEGEQGVIEFHPDDLFIDDNKDIRQMSPYGQECARGLRQSKKIREELAAAINKNLAIAIRNLMDLTPTHIINTFDRIRERMHQEGKSTLILLIEDVANFQGVDRDLVNYLSEPQHDPDKYCKVIGVIGITESYYADLILKENIKDRISHSVELEVGQNVGLFHEPSDAEQFIGKYLNAIRVGTGELKDWYEELDNYEDSPPNKCELCDDQDACHTSFGASEEGYGVYPFTKQAVWNCLKGLKHDSGGGPSLQTPRHLLINVLRPILLQAEERINDGMFPLMPVKNLIEPPRLNSSVSFNKFENYIKRIMPQGQFSRKENYDSLLRYYGNGSTDVTKNEEGVFFSGIHKGVFAEFKMPVKIDGEDIEDPVELPTSNQDDTDIPPD